MVPTCSLGEPIENKRRLSRSVDKSHCMCAGGRLVVSWRAEARIEWLVGAD